MFVTIETKQTCMKTFLLTLFLSTLFYTSAQDYQKRYEDDLYPIISTAICSSEEYGIFITGYVNYNFDGLAYLTDSTGQIQWQFQLDWENDSLFAPRFTEVITTSDSAFLVAGYAFKTGTTDREAIFFKVGNDGVLAWEKRLNLGVTTPDYSVLTELNDSIFCLAYGSRTSGQGVNLVQFNKDGNIINSHGVDFGAPVYASSILGLNDSTIIVTGILNPTISPIGIIAEIDLSGTSNWVVRYPDLSIHDGVILGQNLYLLVHTGFNDGSIAKCDLNGSIQQSFDFYGGNFDLNDAKPHLTKLSDSTLLALIPYYMWPSVIYHLDTSGVLINQMEPELIYAQAIPTHQGGATMVGNGPYYGIKNLYDDHIGVIRRDSIFNQSYCLQVAPNSLNISAGDAPISGNVAFAPGPQVENINATIHGIDMEVVDDCVLFIGSVDELDALEFLSVYPNHSDGIFNLELLEGIEAEIFVYNNLGQLIHNTGNVIGTATMNLTFLENGSYPFKAITRDGRQQNGNLLIHN